VITKAAILRPFGFAIVRHSLVTKNRSNRERSECAIHVGSNNNIKLKRVSRDNILNVIICAHINKIIFDFDTFFVPDPTQPPTTPSFGRIHTYALGAPRGLIAY